MANNFTELLLTYDTPIAYTTQIVIVTIWLCGIVVSGLGLLLQLVLLALMPAIRKYDEKVLTHLTLARWSNALMEYLFSSSQPDTLAALFFKFFFTFYSDYWLICWMFIFTKNLYDKAVVFPNPNHPSWTTVYLLGVVLPVPVALMPALCCLTSDTRYFEITFIVYAVLKVTLNVINVIIFCIIIKVQITMLREINQRRNQVTSASVPASRSYKLLLKVVIVTFVLMCITCLQTLGTDMLSLINGENFLRIYIFSTVNSYQAVAMTGIFLMLMKRNLDKSRTEEIIRRCKCVYSNLF